MEATFCYLGDMLFSDGGCDRAIAARYCVVWGKFRKLLPVLTSRHLSHHDDVIKCKHFPPRNWPFVRRIHRYPVNSPHKGQWREALMLSLICVWINGWVNNREAGDLRRYRAHYDIIVMWGACVCSAMLHVAKLLGTEHLQPQLQWLRHDPLDLSRQILRWNNLSLTTQETWH